VVFVKRILNDELGERKVLDQIKEEKDEIMK
jgi:hypothetical protein